MTDLFEGYAASRDATGAGAAWDEVFDADGSVRPACTALHSALTRTTVRDLRVRAQALASACADRGTTPAGQRPSPLDVVPRVVAAEEWQVVEAGIVQRVRALEAFLADVHGSGRVLEDGVVPRRVVTTSARFTRVAAGIEPPNGVRVHVAAVDLVRGADGAFVVVGTDVRVPTGVAQVLAHRAAMASAVPEAFADQRVRPISSYPRRLLDALRAAAPVGIEDPTVVVLTPGPLAGASAGAPAGTHAEHALLARSTGAELVEGRDLVCRGGRLHVRTTAGLRPVHVVLRGVDDEHLDPVHFRTDSALGVPGLLNAARAGNVTIANAVGNGVADDELVASCAPDLVRYHLSEEPVLADAPTWRLAEPAAREEVLDRLGELVLVPVGDPEGAVVGPAASAAELAELRARVLADPRGWVARPLLAASTAPALVGERMVPQRVDLRVFAVNDGSRVWVLPGGLTRVAPTAEELAGGSRAGAKDTWVLAPGHPDDLSVPPLRARVAVRLPSLPLDAGPREVAAC